MCLTDLANPQYKVVSAQGFEPRTHALEGRCSIQLSYAPTFLKVERVKGIEPSQPAWKAGTLPLSYTRISFRVSTLKTAYHLRFIILILVKSSTY